MLGATNGNICNLFRCADPLIENPRLRLGLDLRLQQQKIHPKTRHIFVTQDKGFWNFKAMEFNLRDYKGWEKKISTWLSERTLVHCLNQCFNQWMPDRLSLIINFFVIWSMVFLLIPEFSVASVHLHQSWNIIQ